MKKLVIILLFLVSTSACKYSSLPSGKNTNSGAVKTEVREVAGFQKVSIGGNMLVELTAGAPAFNVTLEGDENLVGLTRTDIEDGKLVVALREKMTRNHVVKVRISMPILIDLEIAGTSSAVVTGVRGDELALRANGGSKIKIEGEIKTLKAVAHGASAIDAEFLRAQAAEVEALGATGVVVSPAASLKAVTAGISTVLYTGDPKVEKNVSDTSSVKKKS